MDLENHNIYSELCDTSVKVKWKDEQKEGIDLPSFLFGTQKDVLYYNIVIVTSN